MKSIRPAILFFAMLGILVCIAAAPPPLSVETVREMALVPGGEFKMGCDEFGFEHGAPVHSVYLDDFFIDKYEVTNKQFEKIVQEHESRRSAFSSCDDCPVSKVSWYEAADYCYLTGKSLPSEAQWEKAAGGANGCEFPWGPHFNFLYPNAHGGLKLRDKASAVGSYPPNKYGIYDMAGNMWEWTADWYGPYINTGKTIHNPKGPENGIMKVRRGGSWSDSIKAMAVGYRDWSNPQSRSLNDIGFRCVINIAAPK